MQYNLQLRHSEFSIKLALGAQFKHIVAESGGEYLRLLLMSVLLSSLFVLGLYRFLLPLSGAELSGLVEPIMMLPLYLLTLLLVGACGMLAHWFPLRQLKQQPITAGLRGVSG